MREFFECLTIGQLFLASIGSMISLTVVGQIIYWPVRWRSWGFTNRGFGCWLWESFAAGAVAVGVFIVFAGLLDIIYCLICPECGGLL